MLLELVVLLPMGGLVQQQAGLLQFGQPIEGLLDLAHINPTPGLLQLGVGFGQSNLQATKKKYKKNE